MIKSYPYMQEEEFDKLFYEHLIPSPEGGEGNKLWDTTLYEQICEQQDNGKHIFTVVEGDDPHWYASPGFHIVNRIGYLVSSKPIPDSFIEAVWAEGPEDYTQEEDDD